MCEHVSRGHHTLISDAHVKHGYILNLIYIYIYIYIYVYYNYNIFGRIIYLSNNVNLVSYLRPNFLLLICLFTDG